MAGTRIAFTITVISLFCISSTLCDESNKLQRKLKATLNPGCFICDNRTDITLVHIAAESDTDTIHYVWDFTGKPTILVALTGKGAQFQVDWAALFDSKPGSVNFTESPRYTFMAVINRIFQYDDADDRAMLDAGSKVFVYDPHNFTWNRNLLWSNEKDAMMAINAGDDFLFKLNAYSTQDHGMDFPHLLHTSNSTQIDIVFNNITNRFANPRFAVELLFVVSEQAAVSSHFEVTKRKTLDDEHTPGIFEIVDVLSPGAFTFSAGGYMEYRPVSYTHPEREIAFSTETRQSQPVTIDSPSVALNTTLAYALYGNSLGQRLVQGMNVSFGVSEDGFYRKTNYTTMTFQVGYGMPPAEELSAFVLIVASIGIGIPLIVLSVGLLYLCLKKLRNRGRFQQERL
ncbi:glycosylated lysosomal membrane protein-like [Anopheles ziemanni]|uniref:glycosylated lysosomal membrane protein-like n=1 Tax=Anopheles coustani TaxID=139045 RepID=UPI0026592118|nr:glycosylated lysosomal membrane protein-like [Anopheles coustani]XP_058172661.1 glycosylated lysosomal membrane protein-like [Anopheles ziemanni]